MFYLSWEWASRWTPLSPALQTSGNDREGPRGTRTWGLQVDFSQQAHIGMEFRKTPPAVVGRKEGAGKGGRLGEAAAVGETLREQQGHRDEPEGVQGREDKA